MSKVKNCAFKEAVNVASNRNNFNNNRKNQGKIQLPNWR